MSATFSMEDTMTNDARAHFERLLEVETDCWDVNAAMTAGDPAFALLDVRSPEAFAAGHLPGAVNLPHRQISEQSLAGFAPEIPFVVYCDGPHCNGADHAALKLSTLGRKVRKMIGGVEGWKDEGFPLVADIDNSYRNRILEYVGNGDPLRLQASTPEKIANLIRSVPKEQLTTRPKPDKWSVAEIVAHLAEAELVSGYRIRTMLATPGAAIQGYDQDKWAESGRYAGRDPQESLDLFRSLRKANLAFFESLDATQWQLSGIHSERGEESLQLYAALMAGHDINHLKQIEQILG
jgi:rhodanese-related sulfurtransferase